MPHALPLLLRHPTDAALRAAEAAPVTPRDPRRSPSSSRACASPLSESGSPDSRRAISASRSAPDELPHARRGDLSVGALHDAEVVGRERGDLGEVGDDDDLRLLGEPREPSADLDRRGAADPGVDLVEDERRHGIAPGDDDLDREHHPRELAAGRAARDRPRLGAGVRLQQDRDLVAAVSGGLVLGVDAHGEARVGHREGRELGA